MVVNDDEDILKLYSDYLSNKGHRVLKGYLTAENVMNNVERETPDIFVLDHRLKGTQDGLDLAAEILDKNPSAPILFVTANEHPESELSKHRIFDGKKLKVLVKPVKLHDIEMSMLNLV